MKLVTIKNKLPANIGRQKNALPKESKPIGLIALVTIMRPHADDDHTPCFLINTIDQPMLNVDPPRVSAFEIPNKLLVRRLKRISFQCLQKAINLILERTCENVLIVFDRLFCKNNVITHFKSFSQSSFTHSSIGVLIPSTMDSVMPGTLAR